jgi:hypothetical protein
VTEESGPQSPAPEPAERLYEAGPIQEHPQERRLPEPQQQPPAYPQAPMYAAPSTNGFAVASLVLGILWLFWVGSILAVIFGHIATSQIDGSGGRQSGRGMAVAGYVLGYIGLGILVAMMLFPFLLAGLFVPFAGS